MTPLDQLMADYEDYHRIAGNRVCHLAGIPLIVASLLGLLAHWRVGPIDGGLLLLVMVAPWYLAVAGRLGLALVLAAGGAYLVARPLPFGWLWAAMAAGWALQFLGHGLYEKRSPAFFRNLLHLLVGPLWTVRAAGRWLRAVSAVTIGGSRPG